MKLQSTFVRLMILVIAALAAIPTSGAPVPQRSSRWTSRLPALWKPSPGWACGFTARPTISTNFGQGFKELGEEQEGEEYLSQAREIFDRLRAKDWLRKIKRPGACTSPGKLVQ